MTPDGEAERGSAPAEFVLVALLLIALTLGVVQLGAILLVRNTALDAAAEGARWAALSGNTAADGVDRTRQVLTASLGPGYARQIAAVRGDGGGLAAVTVSTPLPVIGLFGPPAGITVTGHAALEPEP